MEFFQTNFKFNSNEYCYNFKLDYFKIQITFPLLLIRKLYNLMTKYRLDINNLILKLPQGLNKALFELLSINEVIRKLN